MHWVIFYSVVRQRVEIIAHWTAWKLEKYLRSNLKWTFIGGLYHHHIHSVQIWPLPWVILNNTTETDNSQQINSVCLKFIKIQWNYIEYTFYFGKEGGLSISLAKHHWYHSIFSEFNPRIESCLWIMFILYWMHIIQTLLSFMLISHILIETIRITHI